MDKMTVGVVLRPDYINTVGGGFSYYSTLVQHIDNYVFDHSLQIVFVNWNQKTEHPFLKPIVHIVPEANYSRKDRLRRKLIYLIENSLLIRSRFFRKTWRRFRSADELIRRRSIEAGLIKNEIDLLYYLIPGENNFNHPYILTHWDNGHLSMYAFPEVALNQTFENRDQYFKTTLLKAFAIFCESNSGKRELVKYTSVNPERVFVVPMFSKTFSNNRFSTEEKQKILEKYSLNAKRFFFYPAQFWAHKNHYNLLVAFKKLLSATPGLKLVLTGSDKGNLSYIKEVINKLALEDNVLLTGFVTDEELVCFYRNAIALVMPTFLGPTNMPLIEAQSLGCPIICSDLEGHREMMGEHASYIKPDDADSIYKCLLHHATNPRKLSDVSNPCFNIQNATSEIEKSLLTLRPIRKTFGTNFQQF